MFVRHEAPRPGCGRQRLNNVKLNAHPVDAEQTCRVAKPLHKIEGGFDFFGCLMKRVNDGQSIRDAAPPTEGANTLTSTPELPFTESFAPFIAPFMEPYFCTFVELLTEPSFEPFSQGGAAALWI